MQDATDKVTLTNHQPVLMESSPKSQKSGRVPQRADTGLKPDALPTWMFNQFCKQAIPMIISSGLKMQVMLRNPRRVSEEARPELFRNPVRPTAATGPGQVAGKLL